jgi:hypothetical protein
VCQKHNFFFFNAKVYIINSHFESHNSSEGAGWGQGQAHTSVPFVRNRLMLFFKPRNLCLFIRYVPWECGRTWLGIVIH